MAQDIDLMKLQDRYQKDISSQTNTLSNLSDENIISTLTHNYAQHSSRKDLRHRKPNCSVIYQKITNYSNGAIRKNEHFEGIFIITFGSSKKYFTSFKHVLKFIDNRELKPKWSVANG